jgi:flavin-dependent dehydrogenase
MCLRHTGQWVTWAADPRFVPFGEDEGGPWLGYQVWRADFDALLLTRARALGVEVLQPCRAHAPLVEGGRVAGVRCERGELRARFVVDASGGGHWLARRLGLRVRTASPRLIARYGYCKGECQGRDAAPAIVADRDGWTWTARVRDGLYQWTRLALDRRGTADALPPGECRGLRPEGHARGSDVTWRIVASSAGPGYFLVGDAAAVLDPAASHGILKALMSGILVGHLISRGLCEGHDERLLSESYRGWVSSWFRHDVEQLTERYLHLGRVLTGGAHVVGLRQAHARKFVHTAGQTINSDSSENHY